MEIVISLRDGKHKKEVEKMIGAKLKKNSPVSTTIFLAEVAEDFFDKTMLALNASPLVVAADKNTHGYTIQEEAE